MRDQANVKDKDSSMFRLPLNCFPLLESIVADTDWFDQQVDACRVAVALALAKGMQSAKEPGDTLETKFSISTLDPDASLRELVLALAPHCGDRPYEYAQRIAVKGIHFLHNELVQRGRPLPEVLGLSIVRESKASDAG